MDPLSITASAITIIQLTFELIQGTRNYYKNVKNAPREIAEFLDQLETLGTVLERLKQTSEKADAAQSSQTALNGGVQSSQNASCLPLLKEILRADGPLAICYEQMSAFKRRLNKDQSRFKKSLKWPFEKDEIKEAVTRLRNLKSVLNTAILSDNLYVLNWWPFPGHFGLITRQYIYIYCIAKH
jgi:hypothetical protein